MKLTQCQMILELTREGFVTPLVALQEAGCMRLGARICELKAEGHIFEEKMFSHDGRFGKKSYKGFRLIEESPDQMEMFQ